MATAGDRSVFIDTNILVYHTIRESPFHAAARNVLDEMRVQGYPCWVSRQVLREYLAVLTRPGVFRLPPPIDALLDRVGWMEQTFHMAEDGPLVTRLLCNLLRRSSARGNQVHDANIVATMLAHDVSCVLTQNTADFMAFSDAVEVRSLEQMLLR